jgi:hypothetical protein
MGEIALRREGKLNRRTSTSSSTLKAGKALGLKIPPKSLAHDARSASAHEHVILYVGGGLLGWSAASFVSGLITHLHTSRRPGLGGVQTQTTRPTTSTGLFLPCRNTGSASSWFSR